jgi:hypothetical protein
MVVIIPAKLFTVSMFMGISTLLTMTMAKAEGKAKAKAKNRSKYNYINIL